HLSFGSDVEQARSEPDRDREADQDERGRRDEGLRDRVQGRTDLVEVPRGDRPSDLRGASQGAREQRVVRLADSPPGGRERSSGVSEEALPSPERRLVGDDDQDGADDERHRYGEEGKDHHTPP